MHTRPGSLGEDDLIEALQGMTMVGIRSNTKITERVLDARPDLRAIGAFCIGTNQIDLAAAAARGVAAFNAPYSNTRSVVELVIAEIIALARRLPEKTGRMHDGVWDKSAQGSHEVRGRTLGIVGYGNIGTQLSNLAESMGLRVIFFDTADRLAHGNARRVGTPRASCSSEADVVSLHVDGRPGNAGLFGAAQFAQMKPRSLFINASRGMVVDDVALREHILSGHIAGAALDVFPVEPKAQGDPFESALRGLPNVILTPHVGGSTQEAQEEIGFFVSGKLSALPARRQHRAVGQPARGRRSAARRRLADRAAAPQRPGRARLGQPGAGRPRRPTCRRSTSPPAASRATSSPTSTTALPDRGPRRAARTPTRRSGCAPGDRRRSAQSRWYAEGAGERRRRAASARSARGRRRPTPRVHEPPARAEDPMAKRRTPARTSHGTSSGVSPPPATHQRGHPGSRGGPRDQLVGAVARGPRVDPAETTAVEAGQVGDVAPRAVARSRAASKPWKSHGTPPSSAHISAQRLAVDLEVAVEEAEGERRRPSST